MKKLLFLPVITLLLFIGLCSQQTNAQQSYCDYGSAGNSKSIPVTNNQLLVSLNISFEVEYYYYGAYNITLTSPQGTVAALITSGGCWSGYCEIYESFSLSNFAGENFNGTWILNTGLGEIYSTCLTPTFCDADSSINVQGNTIDIPDGTTTTSTSDNTHLGSANIGSSVTQSFTILNTGTEPLIISNLVSSSSNFVVSNAPPSVAASGSATFNVTFIPSFLGENATTINIISNNCDALKYDFQITGYGFQESGSNAWIQQGNALSQLYNYETSTISADGNIMANGSSIFQLNCGSWQQRDNTIDYGNYSKLSADGNVVAVGRPFLNNQRGQVSVYVWDGSNYQQQGDDIDGEVIGNNYGRSISLSADGSIIAIGTSRLFYQDETDSGHVRIYAWDGSSWQQQGNDIDGEAIGDLSGNSVSLSADGNIVAIGAPFNDGNGTDSGHVRIYAWGGSSWQQQGNDIDGEAAINRSGISVSLSADGNIVAIGAPLNDGNGTYSGHVRIYAWNGSSWQQQGNDIDGEAADNSSGGSVSLSADGNIVAIGAPSNDGNGTYSGHVRIYAWDGSSWQQQGNDIDGEAANNRIGISVSLSSDGSIVAIGAYSNGLRAYVFNPDASYNCGTVSTTPPEIVCPTNITVTNDAGVCNAVVDFIATETVGVPVSTITYSQDPNTEFSIGITTVTATATNEAGSSSCEFTVTVTDTEGPVITCPTPEVSYPADSGFCSASLTFEATSTDNCGVASTVYSVDGLAISFPNAFAVGTTTVDVLVTDVHDNTSNCSFDVTVNNNAPNSIEIDSPAATPQPIGSNVEVSATFDDENIATATWIAFDGNTEVQTATLNITGTSTSHTFVDLPAGVYTIILKLIDHCGLETVAQWQYAVIYDPNGGFVTGGGWFNSLAGNMPHDLTAEGKASFGFVAKYKTGKNNTNEVDGNTNFQFKEGNFHFKSSLHTDMSLVISGERKATYKGSGTVNGSGAYGFMVTVVDGEAPGAGQGDVDTFRIKVWDGSPSNVVYDNEIGSAENTDAITTLGGGSIVIHKPKGNTARTSNSKSAPIVEDIFEGLELVSWPNPSNSYFNIKLKSGNTLDQINIQVFDLNGRLVSFKTGDPNEVYQIGSRLQSGLYFINVVQGNESKQIKLIKY